MGKLSLGGEGWDLGLGCPTKVCACLSLCQWPLLVTETGVIWIRGCLSATMSCLDDVSIHNCETSSNEEVSCEGTEWKKEERQRGRKKAKKKKTKQQKKKKEGRGEEGKTEKAYNSMSMISKLIRKWRLHYSLHQQISTLPHIRG